MLCFCCVTTIGLKAMFRNLHPSHHLQYILKGGLPQPGRPYIHSGGWFGSACACHTPPKFALQQTFAKCKCNWLLHVHWLLHIHLTFSYVVFQCSWARMFFPMGTPLGSPLGFRAPTGPPPNPMAAKTHLVIAISANKIHRMLIFTP
jgi:hypothetical protein